MGGKSGGVADVTGAAKEAGYQARLLNQEQTQANRPNQYNPWGSTTWTQDTTSAGPPPVDPSQGNYDNIGDYAAATKQYEADKAAYDGAAIQSGQWTQRETLNPALQASLDAQFETQQGRSELAASRLDDLRNEMGQSMDFDQYGDPIAFDPTEQRQAAEDAAYARSTSRLDPQYQSQQEAMQLQMRNRGLREGDAQYDAAMASFGRDRNDAYEQARLGATAEGRDETGLGLQTNERANALRTQAMQEEMTRRGMTLEEINALMAGQEIEGSTPSSEQSTTIADMLKG